MSGRTILPMNEQQNLSPILMHFPTFFEISFSSGVSNRGEKEDKPHWLDTDRACHLYYRGQIQSTLLTCQRYPNKTFSKMKGTPFKGNFTLFQKFPIAHSGACLTWELSNSLPISHSTIMRNQKVIISRVQVFIEKVTMPWAISERPRPIGSQKNFSSLSWSKKWNWPGPKLNVSKYSHSILP